MNKDEVVYLYYALSIKIRIEFNRFYTLLKYPANIPSVSLRTFVECLYDIVDVLYVNTIETETFSGMSLYMKVIGSDVYTSVSNNYDDLGFPIVNSPWMSGAIPRLPSYGVYISQLVTFDSCCTSVSDFHFKNLQITSKPLTKGYRYHSFESIWVVLQTIL